MTFKTPLFSIIIPTYNSGETLSMALESVIKQTFDAYEIIIIDGLSTDRTLDVVKSYQIKTPKLHLISEADRGIYDAMNKGIGMAKGKWLYFLGSDDSLFDACVLKKIANFIETKNVDVVYGNVKSNFYGGIYDGVFDYEKLTRKNICHQAIFFKKLIFNKTGYYNLKYKTGADWDHNFKWFFNSNIRHEFLNIIVANFADGGASHTQKDYSFEKDKHYTLLRLGLKKLPFRVLKRISKLEIEKARTNKKYLNLIFYKSYFYVIRLGRKFKEVFRTK